MIGWLNGRSSNDHRASSRPDFVTGRGSTDEPTRFRLPSKEGLNFDVTAVVCFRAASDVVTPDPLTVAVVAIRRRAEAISMAVSLTDTERLWSELDVELARLRPTDHPRVQACALDVEVSAVDSDVEAVAAHQRSRAAALLGDWEWEHRQNRAEQILKLLADPSHATAWWLASASPDDLGRAEQAARTFVNIAQILGLDDEPRNGAVDVIARLWHRLDRVDRHGLVNVLGDYSERIGDPGLSDALKRLGE